MLKIFFPPLGDEKLEDYYWGTPWRHYTKDRTEEIGRISKLSEATTIQNLCWMEGLAPRVYGICLIKKGEHLYPAQLIEYIEGEPADDPQASIEVLERYLTLFHCRPCHKELAGHYDFIDGKLIDFQGFRYTPKTKQAVTDYVIKNGQYGKGHYQSIPKLGLTAKPRDTEYRIKEMKLNDIDFDNKDVFDIGCSLGAFCNYAEERGARRVFGCDLKVKAPQVVAFYLGNHNIDYFEANILEPTFAMPKVDITFFLSMNVHVGFPSWIPDITKELLIFEENAKQSKFNPDYWVNHLSNYFKSVEIVGHANDQNKAFYKPIYHCYTSKQL